MMRLLPGTVNLVARIFSHQKTAAALRYRPHMRLSAMTTHCNGARHTEEAEDVIRFHEEPLGLPTSSGFGFMQVDIGDEIGELGRYRVLRKLGYGMYSTVWLAQDAGSSPADRPQYVALKVSTTNATVALDAKRLDEVNILRRIADTDSDHLGKKHSLIIRDSFLCAGKEDPGPHHCIATELLGTDLVRLRRQYPGRVMPLPIVKKIARQMLAGLDYLHTQCRIVHTDLKADNIMTAHSFSNEEITLILENEPPAYYPPQDVLGCQVHPIVSQPLPAPSISPEHFMCKIGDFGHAQWIDKQVTDDISPIALRAPETILGHSWGEKVDIWAFGCLIFELLTGAALFDPKADPGGKFTADDQHLLRMMQIKEEAIPEDMLLTSIKAGEFFETTGKLRRIRGTYTSRSIYECLANYILLDTPDELENAAAFLDWCLEFKPDERGSANQLAYHCWLEEK